MIITIKISNKQIPIPFVTHLPFIPIHFPLIGNKIDLDFLTTIQKEEQSHCD
jgi:hypothetical protein